MYLLKLFNPKGSDPTYETTSTPSQLFINTERRYASFVQTMHYSKNSDNIKYNNATKTYYVEEYVQATNTVDYSKNIQLTSGVDLVETCFDGKNKTTNIWSSSNGSSASSHAQSGGEFNLPGAINAIAFALGNVSSLYEGHLSNQTNLLEKSLKGAFANKKPLEKAIDFNKAMMKGTKIAGKALFGVGVVMSIADVIENKGSAESVGWAALDTGMGILGFVPGFQVVTGVYFVGRMAYQIYNEGK